MPLWFDLLRTPMAAPETRELRRMRRTWQGLCVLLALVAGLFGPFHRLGGRVAIAATAAILIGTVLYAALYLARKHRADSAFIGTAGEEA